MHKEVAELRAKLDHAIGVLEDIAAMDETSAFEHAAFEASLALEVLKSEAGEDPNPKGNLSATKSNT